VSQEPTKVKMSEFLLSGHLIGCVLNNLRQCV